MDDPMTPEQVRSVLLTMQYVPDWPCLVGRFLHRKVEGFTPDNYDVPKYSARDLGKLIIEFIETYQGVIRNPNWISLSKAEKDYQLNSAPLMPMESE